MNNLELAKHKLNLLHLFTLIYKKDDRTSHQFHMNSFHKDPLLPAFFDLYEWLWKEPFFLAPKERIDCEVIYGYDCLENHVKFISPEMTGTNGDLFTAEFYFMFTDPLTVVEKDNLKNYTDIFETLANSSEYGKFLENNTKENFLIERFTFDKIKFSWDCLFRTPLHVINDEWNFQGHSHISIYECVSEDSREDDYDFDARLTFFDWNHPEETRNYYYFVNLNEEALKRYPNLSEIYEHCSKQFYRKSS